MKNGTEFVKLVLSADGFEFAQASRSSRLRREWLVGYGVNLERRDKRCGQPVDAVVRVDVGVAGFKRGDDPRVHMRSGASMLLSSLIYSRDLSGCVVAATKTLRKVKPSMSVALVPMVPEAAQPPADPLAGCIRDEALAAQYGLVRQRDIRRTIKAAIAAGEICEVTCEGRAAGAHPHDGVVPAVHAVVETASGNTTTVYYLTEAAKRIVVLRLDTAKAKATRAQVHQTVASPPPPTGLDAVLAAMTQNTAAVSAMAAQFAVLVERVLPAANQNAPFQLPARAVVVEAPPEGFNLSQTECARRSALPSDGPGARLFGDWARALDMYGKAPHSAWSESAFHGKVRERGMVVYAPTFLSVMSPAIEAAQREMHACRFSVQGGRLTPFREGAACSKESCAERMARAGLDAMRKAG